MFKTSTSTNPRHSLDRSPVNRGDNTDDNHTTIRTGPLASLTRLVQRHPHRVLAAALLFLVLCTAYGAPAMWKLPGGGQETPGTESMLADQVLDEKFAAGGSPIVFTVTSDDGVDSSRAAAMGNRIVDALKTSPYTRQVISYWTTPIKTGDNALVSEDRRTGLVAARVTGSDRDAPPRAAELASHFQGEHDGVRVTAGGEAIAFETGTVVSREDLLVMEAIAIPFTFVVLVWIFGSLVASAIPMLVGLCAIAGTTAALWLIHAFTDVSIFALNVATALGLALAVDYTLFIVNRYREEIARGSTPSAALHTTMSTAGRTVTYSALTMALTLATLLVFPQYLLQSLGYAGVIVVGLALLASLTVAPALIVALGSKLDAFDIRQPVNRWLHRPAPRLHTPEHRFWYRAATFAMRRSILVTVVAVALLALLSWPATNMNLGSPDDRNTPVHSDVHLSGEILRSDFPRQNHAGTVRIVLPTGVRSPADVTNYALALSTVPDVTTVAGPNGMYAAGKPVNAGTYDSSMRADSAYLSVGTTLDPFSAAGKQQLQALREVPAPAPTLFAGMAQRDLDNVRGITDKIPIVIALVAIITLALIFMMTGSVLLPVKAVAMNMLALTAAFGVMVWIFQEGHLGGLGTTGTGHTTVFIPPLMACIAYALAMDYEVFVLSRIREEWLRSDRRRGSNERSVALGLAYTGRIVTAAAVVMVIVFIAISAGRVSFMRGLGIGLAVGVLLDAFIIRTLLVPAVMHLAGRWNWWAPSPLARLHDRWGLTDSDDEPTPPVTPSDPESQPSLQNQPTHASTTTLAPSNTNHFGPRTVEKKD